VSSVDGGTGGQEGRRGIAYKCRANIIIDLIQPDQKMNFIPTVLFKYLVVGVTGAPTF
jgi:hypothetical protein